MCKKRKERIQKTTKSQKNKKKSTTGKRKIKKKIQLSSLKSIHISHTILKHTPPKEQEKRTKRIA